MTNHTQVSLMKLMEKYTFGDIPYQGIQPNEMHTHLQAD
jgi:hypothetical protein